MADTRFYESAVEFPTIDYGAIYENAKARRELADEKKLGYLNQFQQERSAFAPGIQQEMQKMWNNIQSDLGSGDMSFEAKARRQSMYNNYKDTAAQGLEYSNMLNEYEAQILSDPSSYNSPDLLIAKIQEDRNTDIPLGELANAMASYPSIGTFRRFSMKEMSPQGAAGNILNNLKTSGGLQNFYDMKGAGGIQDNVLTQTVSDFFSANSLTQEEEDQAIVYMLRQTGALSGNMSDLTNVRNLTEEQRAQKLGDFATYTAKQLKNMIASDIETTREEDARRIRMARAEQVIKNNMEAQKNTANVFQSATGSFDYMAPMVADETGQIKTSTGIKPVVADDIIGNFKITGTQPSYKDINGRTTYIERGGITKDGQQVVVIRYEQDVINTMTSRADKYTAREVVPWSEVINGAGSGLSNMAQASKIQNTFDQLGVPTQAAPYMGLPPGVQDVVNIAAKLPRSKNQVTGMDAYGNPIVTEGGNFSNPESFLSKVNPLSFILDLIPSSNRKESEFRTDPRFTGNPKEVEALVQEYKNSDPDDEMRQEALVRRVNRLGAKDKDRYLALINQIK